tara:strand:+ start:163 stop:612 length:450 start_codon:yes stop_codon:yes gene_type:complete
MSEMFPFFYSLGAWNWLVLGGVLIGLEILVSGVFLIWFGLAALIVGAIALGVDISWQIQFILFAVLALAAVMFSRRFFKNNDESDKPLLNQRAEQNIGRSFVLTKPILHGRGRIQIADSTWAVEGEDCAEGTMVKVVDVEGSTLKVEPA